jgi:hypothetical protein
LPLIQQCIGKMEREPLCMNQVQIKRKTIIKNTIRNNMTFSKITLAIIFAILSIGLSACTENQKESAKEVGSEAEKIATQAKEKSLNMYEKTKNGTSELANKATFMASELKEKAISTYDVTAEKATVMASDIKDKASDKYDATVEKASDVMYATKKKATELKTDASKKIKETCIATKEKLGQDPIDC